MTTSPSVAYGQARGCRFLRLAWVPMRDGVRLATTIFLPERPGRYPVVVQRTPYGRLGWLDGWDQWVANGYVFVCQDTRGRNDSEGQFYPMLHETTDTPDTIAWIRQQEWCNGQVGTMGPSYLGWIQYLGVVGGAGAGVGRGGVVSAGPAVPGGMPDAILPTFLPGDAYIRGFYNYGTMSLFLSFWWLCFDVGSRVNNNGALGFFDVEKLCRHLPLETIDLVCGAGVAPVWRELTEHITRDPWHEQITIRGKHEHFTMPSLQVCGWYDYYPGEMIYNWQQMRAKAKTPEIARGHKLLLGPWGHHHGLEPTADGQRAVDFGPESGFYATGIYRKWFDRVFKGIAPADGLGDRPLRLFVMGANQWRDEDEWPLARTRWVNYYLHSGGKANTRHGDGALRLAPPTEASGAAAADRFDYDPANPVMTRGGNHSIGPWNDFYKKLIWCGPCDQGPNEDRADVLVYTTPPLEADLEVTGPVTLKLWASTSGPDTDWVGRLVDVHPDGKAINLTEGVIRARFRAGDWTKPELVTPGTVLEYAVDLQVTSNLFKKGHRIRLEITSSNFPLWDRNLNTGEHPNRSAKMAVAHQTIWHDRSRPSHLVLPVIP